MRCASQSEHASSGTMQTAWLPKARMTRSPRLRICFWPQQMLHPEQILRLKVAMDQLRSIAPLTPLQGAAHP